MCFLQREGRTDVFAWDIWISLIWNNVYFTSTFRKGDSHRSRCRRVSEDNRREQVLGQNHQWSEGGPDSSQILPPALISKHCWRLSLKSPPWLQFKISILWIQSWGSTPGVQRTENVYLYFFFWEGVLLAFKIPSQIYVPLRGFHVRDLLPATRILMMTIFSMHLTRKRVEDNFKQKKIKWGAGGVFHVMVSALTGKRQHICFQDLIPA